MTEQEIRQLLAVAMAYDNRKPPGQANIAAWKEQAQRHRWRFDEALEAIHTHYGESTEFLAPAHVTARIRTVRREPAQPADVLALPSAPPAQPTHVQELLDEVAQRLGWRPRRPDPATVAAMQVTCPHCHACPGRPCTRRATRGPRQGQYLALAGIHPSRRDAAEQARPTP